MTKKNNKLTRAKRAGKPQQEQPESQLKSREARQKLRRWTFAAEMKLESGQKAGFHIPGMIYGNAQEAKQCSADLLAKFKSDETAPQDVNVVPIPHETVSAATKRQFQGMNDQVNLITKAAFILAEKVRLISSDDKAVTDILNEAVTEAREHLFPKLKEAQLKMDALENLSTVEDATAEALEVVSPAAIDQPPVEKPRRKLGIDAVREILDSPVAA